MSNFSTNKVGEKPNSEFLGNHTIQNCIWSNLCLCLFKFCFYLDLFFSFSKKLNEST